MRPLGDMLTELPAFEDASDPSRAGPAYRCPRRVDFLPHNAGWEVLLGQLVELRDSSKVLCARADMPAALRPRFQLLYENFWRLADNFAVATGQSASVAQEASQ
jgi:hypothetical protein